MINKFIIKVIIERNMDLKKTLALFETDMPIRVNFKELDAHMQNFYTSNDIFDFVTKAMQGREKYTLHDGPPYANGPIHLGHAYNKIMKDICIRSHIMMGYDAYVTPGWDCHGLPIEHKVMQNNNFNRLEMKKECRKYASHWINEQRESFKKLAIMMNFDNPYQTMNFDYQSDIVRAFGVLIKKGFISRANKTIPWCCSCQTALATAEIEYKDRKDPSLYVLFSLVKDNFYDKFFSDYDEVSLVIWTTTPWTLPLNRGIMIKKNAIYILILCESKYMIIGKACLDHFISKVGKKYSIIKTINADDLVCGKVNHPFEKITVPIIVDESVELGEGTACVHTAPGCGPIDYEIGIKNNLEIYSPISNDGKYTKEIKVPELVDMKISDALGWVITKLQEKGLLFYKGSINHSYPHCWRSQDGLIFRATPQWFCNLEKDNFKDLVISAIDKINFYPAASKSFLKSTIANRWEWCISRQRAWGVPIIAFINKNDGAYWTSQEFINFVSAKINKEGVEYWDKVNISDLTEHIPSFINEENWSKETDILDVWFDSGVSHCAVLEKQNRFPADVYLEGVDQHRGWFQSSLLTSIALTGKIPMKNIVSCGHTVDEKGQKMSKSLGNVVSPEDIIKVLGLDGLRLWVSSVNLGGDIVVGKKVFENIGEVYRKLRNTCRFAVQNVVDFDPQKDMISFDSLGFVNQLIIRKLYLYQDIIISSYNSYDFPNIFHTFIEIATNFLSSFYFDTLKDILYCDQVDGQKRKSAQTVLYIFLETITRLMAPILPYTAEDISNYYKSSKGKTIANCLFYDFVIFKDSSYFKDIYRDFNIKNIQKNDFYTSVKMIDSFDIEYLIDQIMKLREDVFKATETLRQKNIIKQSIESKIEIQYSSSKDNKHILVILSEYIDKESFFDVLCQLLCVSDIKLFEVSSSDIKNTIVIAEKHLGQKCNRCWKYFYNKNNEHICQRCKEVIETIKI